MKISPEVARIHAHLCGDGCIYVANEKHSLNSLKNHPRKNLNRHPWILSYYNTCEELIQQFRQDMLKAFNRNLSYRKEKIETRARGVKHIVKELHLEDKNSRNWSIPLFITNAQKFLIKEWLMAFFDDEATVDLNRCRIRIKLMNKEGLLQIMSLLKKFGVCAVITGKNKDDSWYLSINKPYVKNFTDIGFYHPEKKKKFSILLTKMGGGGFSQK